MSGYGYRPCATAAKDSSVEPRGQPPACRLYEDAGLKIRDAQTRKTMEDVGFNRIVAENGPSALQKIGTQVPET